MSNVLKRILFLFLLCCQLMPCFAQGKEYPVIVKDNNEFYQYSPETGEGIYSISRRFGVPMTELLRHNPALENGLKKGDIVLVPVKKPDNNQYHIIAPKETIYSVSKQYGITSEELIAANTGISPDAFPIGCEIIIPKSKTETTPAPAPTPIPAPAPTPAKETQEEDELFFEEKESFIDESSEETIEEIADENGKNEITTKVAEGEIKSTYSVVLMLPFTGSATENDNSKASRYIEYYEGFLMAVNDMKEKGLSIDLRVYDTGVPGKEVTALLSDPIMDQADLIIGGIDQKEIKELSDFTKSRGVKYVVPYSSKDNTDLANPNLFQINPPQKAIQEKAARVYAEQLKGKNVIFVDCAIANDKSNKQEFVQLLKLELQKTSTPFSEMAYSSAFMTKVKAQMSSDRVNAVILSSASAEALKNIVPSLRTIETTNPSLDISLYGYPEWQVHAREILEDLFILDTHFFATFFANNTSPEVKNFYGEYKRWYHKNLLPLYPKYGMLGYDSGMFLLNALNRFGTGFHLELNSCAIPLLQSSFDFQQKDADNLYLNMNLFIVRLTPDFIVEKTLVR